MLTQEHFRKPDPGLGFGGNAGFDTICHLVPWLWRRCQSKPGSPPSLRSQITSAADVTTAADSDSSGVRPTLHSGVLTEDQMLKSEVQGVFYDWKCAFNVFPGASNKGKVGQCQDVDV